MQYLTKLARVYGLRNYPHHHLHCSTIFCLNDCQYFGMKCIFLQWNFLITSPACQSCSENIEQASHGNANIMHLWELLKCIYFYSFEYLAKIFIEDWDLSVLYLKISLIQNFIQPLALIYHLTSANPHTQPFTQPPTKL